jgi:predicted TIM-barrel fold metal-dependent hydrolase/3-hydroxyisobutyrate dehydrogenase-like beta-hydroxyacid dehydrogenase
MQHETQTERIAVVGLGEVGAAMAQFLRDSGAAVVPLVRSDDARRRAQAMGLVPEDDPARAAAWASLILIAVPGAALTGVMRDLAPGLGAATLVVDLTAAPPESVEQAAALHPGGPAQFVDGAIMGAISLQGAQVPIILAGPGAPGAAPRLAARGLQVRVLSGARIGDASRAKLLRSVLAKGLDALMVEAALAAEAAGLTDEFHRQLDNFDRSPMRAHCEMYLSTHVRHARRRGTEMEATADLLRALGLPSLTTAATVARYRRSAALADREADHGAPPCPEGDGAAALAWLLRAERRHGAGEGTDTGAPTKPADLTAGTQAGRATPAPPRIPPCLAPRLAEPPQRLRPPPGAWDTHVHVIGSPLLYPFATQRHFDPPEAPAATLLAMLDRLGLAHAAIVQPSVHGTDNRLLVETLLQHADRLRGVAVIDDAIPDAERARLAEAGVMGVRLLDIVGGGVGLASLERQAAICTEMGWHLQLGLKGESFPAQARRIAAIRAPVVIDHMGWCPAAQGTGTEAFHTVMGLVRDHGCWVKLSGAFRLSSEGPPWGDTVDMARRIIAAAPDRVLWGSDWPHVGLYDPALRPDAGALLDWLADVVPEPEAQAAILVRNPAALYGVPGAGRQGGGLADAAGAWAAPR